MKTSRLLATATVLVFSALSSGAAFASSITVNNSDFQIRPAGGITIPNPDGAFSEGSIPDWTIGTGGVAGEYLPTASAFNGFNGTEVIAYSNGATVSQIVDATVNTGDTYTLTVDLGNRLDEPFDGGADLLIDGVVYKATGTTPVNGDFGFFTATYTGLSADQGDSITIQLTSSGAQGNFSDVSLTDTPATNPTGPTGPGEPPAVPEPSSLVLLGTGVLGAFGAVRRRFVKA